MGLENNKSNFERFLGENLIGKLGIVITLIGVAIGIKYLIKDVVLNDLIIQLIGYSIGLILCAAAIAFKKKYANFSAILMSGGIAMLYIQTYISFDIYHTFNQVLSFLLLVGLTITAMYIAVWYDTPVIAHLGFIGAYAIPILINQNEGKHLFFLSYLFLVNAGVVFLTLKKEWKSLNFTSILFTYIVLIVWLVVSESTTPWYGYLFGALLFSLFHFSLFWQERKDTTKTDSLAFTLLIANSILAYVFIQNASEASYVSSYAGLIVGAVHGVSAFILKRQANHNSTYVNLHLIISVIALNAYVAFEVQTSNVGWIFALETAILIGLANQFLSKSLMLVAFVVQLLAFVLTLAQMGYGQEGDNFPFFHSTAQYAWSSLVLLLTAYFLNKRVADKLNDNWSQTLSFTLPIFSVLLILFLGIREITHYFDMRYFQETAFSTINDFQIPIAISNERLLDYKSIWVIQFLFALWGVILLGKRYISRDSTLGLNIVLTVFVTISTTISLIIGFWNLNKLRIEAFNYLSNPPEFFVPAFPPTWYDVQLRYYFLVVVAFLLFALYRFSTSTAMPRALAVIQRLFMHVVILWSLASEVIGWSVQFNSNPSYRFGISVTLSLYSFFLIALGIRKAAKYLCFAGLTLFFITLLKLFAFDIWILNSLAKTIAFISLGLLMLLVSFLYGKYKTKLFGSEE
jgi:uncharacterized membrane protein